MGEPMRKLRKRRAGSNLVDSGRFAAHAHPRGQATPTPDETTGQEATVKACGVAVAMLPEHSWTPPSSTGHMVNVGTIPGRPTRRPAGVARGRLVAS